MTPPIQDRVLQTLGRYSMVRPGDRIGVGVSGGADSVALLHLLAELRSKLGVGLFVLHFHHQLRGIEADEDERFVEALAAELGFEFIAARTDVAAEARRNAWNLEDAARRLRYQFFASTTASRKLDRVAVAHSADDQAETVLAHLLRGTGLTGLAGIYPVAGSVIRPLLEIGRGELREYLSNAGRPWREDATNQDTSRVRARIRHQLLPMLLRDFEPSVVTRLSRLADLAREEERFWRALEEERLTALAVREDSDRISIKITDLLSPMQTLNEGPDERVSSPAASGAPTLALTRRLVRRTIAHLRGSLKQVTARHVQDVLDLALESNSGARIELPGIVVERTFDRLLFSTGTNHESQSSRPENQKDEAFHREFEYPISLPDPSKAFSIVVPEIKRRFHLKLIDWPSAPRETISHRGALDFDRLRWPVILRNWRAGDSYRPYGHRRTRKLKRLFLESRIPRVHRATWPVLTSAGEIVWASGYPAAVEFAPHSNTLTGLMIEEEFEDSTS